MRDNLSGNNGTGGKTASAHLRDTKIENVLVGGPDFWGEVDRRSRETCEKIAKEKLEEHVETVLKHINMVAKWVISPLLAAICGISIWIFSTTNQQLNTLNHSVQILNETMATIAANLKSMERESDDNKRAIEKLQEKIYR